MPCTSWNLSTWKKNVWKLMFLFCVLCCICQLMNMEDAVNSNLNATTKELQTYVDKAIAEALSKYDADKTGLVDYALKTVGGDIVSIRDTQPYVVDWSYSYFGLYCCATIVAPSTILQVKTQPGDCWPFTGSKGTAVIKLISPVVITGLTYEHAAKSLLINENISSAPLEFTLKGLLDLEDSGFTFGKFTFDPNGPPIQYFPVQLICNRPYELAEFTVLSNNGNKNFTCLYRVRIHGTVPS